MMLVLHFRLAIASLVSHEMKGAFHVAYFKKAFSWSGPGQPVWFMQLRLCATVVDNRNSAKSEVQQHLVKACVQRMQTLDW